MKRFILILLLAQTPSMYSVDSHEQSSNTISLKKALVITAVLTVPFAIAKALHWWQERTIHALSDVQLLGELQKRLYTYQVPFEYAAQIAEQRERTTSHEELEQLNLELKTIIIQFTDTTSYRFLKFAEELKNSIENIRMLQKWAHERFESVSDQHKGSLRDVEERINLTLSNLTRLHDFVLMQSEFDKDYYNDLQDNSEYEPSYL